MKRFPVEQNAYETGKQIQLNADQKAVRELFEEIEEHWEIVAEMDKAPYFRFDYSKYQALKTKYLGVK